MRWMSMPSGFNKTASAIKKQFPLHLVSMNILNIKKKTIYMHMGRGDRIGHYEKYKFSWA